MFLLQAGLGEGKDYHYSIIPFNIFPPSNIHQTIIYRPTIRYLYPTLHLYFPFKYLLDYHIQTNHQIPLLYSTLHLSIYLYIYLSILTIYLSIYLSIYVSIYLSIYLSIYIYLSICYSINSIFCFCLQVIFEPFSQEINLRILIS